MFLFNLGHTTTPLRAPRRTTDRLWAITGWSRLALGRATGDWSCHQAAGRFSDQGHVSAAYSSEEHPMAQRKHEPGPPMDLANMRLQDVQWVRALRLVF